MTGDIDRFTYIFIGDFVDKGFHSLEVLFLLLSLKAVYGERIVLLRGNHDVAFSFFSHVFFFFWNPLHLVLQVSNSKERRVHHGSADHPRRTHVLIIRAPRTRTLTYSRLPRQRP